MRFLIDAQLPPALARLLDEHGHQADHVNQIGPGDAPDRVLWRYALDHDAVIVTKDEDFADMVALGGEYASKGGFWENDASQSGCDPGAEWCVHVTLVNTKPHDPTNADPTKDYSDFAGRPVCTSYVAAKANEAGLM